MLKIARINRLWVCIHLESGRVLTDRTIKGILAQLRIRHQIGLV